MGALVGWIGAGVGESAHASGAANDVASSSKTAACGNFKAESSLESQVSTGSIAAPLERRVPDGLVRGRTRLHEQAVPCMLKRV